MEINEKTRFNFDGSKAFTIIAFVALSAWAIHTYISSQTERDDKQDNKIDIVDAKVESLKIEFKESQKQINQKLDKIIEKQESDHDIVIRHEYSNLNKPYYSK